MNDAVKTPDADAEALVVWRFVDGKPGHESQSMGLVQALSEMVKLRTFDLSVHDCGSAVLHWLAGRFPAGADLPSPDLMIGAGHATHRLMLAARRARGGRVVVLMRPTLPLSWFDLCLIPQHDSPPGSAKVIATTGVLNTIQPSEKASFEKGLVLIGGPSSHYDWDNKAILNQVTELVEKAGEVQWTLTTSRRTPEASVRELQALDLECLEVVPFSETPQGWVADRLEECGHVWVTEDSVSMVFEAMTAGAEVGLLSVPKRSKKSRVQASMEILLSEKRVFCLADGMSNFERNDAAERKVAPLAEARRCAELVIESLDGLESKRGDA